MKVLKFGGTSVANAKSLINVIDIITQSKDQVVVVVSALGGITNLLVEMSERASMGQNNYKEHLETLENRHLNPIEYFIPLTHQSEIISFLKGIVTLIPLIFFSLISEIKLFN